MVRNEFYSYCAFELSAWFYLEFQFFLWAISSGRWLYCRCVFRLQFGDDIDEKLKWLTIALTHKVHSYVINSVFCQLVFHELPSSLFTYVIRISNIGNWLDHIFNFYYWKYCTRITPLPIGIQANIMHTCRVHGNIVDSRCCDYYIIQRYTSIIQPSHKSSNPLIIDDV